jgi:hypothetical protein
MSIPCIAKAAVVCGKVFAQTFLAERADKGATIHLSRQ